MKMLRTLCAAVVCASTCVSIANAFDDDGVVKLFVSATGSDQWSGRLPQARSDGTDGPLATLDRARQVIQGIDRAGLHEIDVFVRGGTYLLTSAVLFQSADSGSASVPIAYAGYPGESAIISGGLRVRDWVNVGGNRWQALLPGSTQFFENLYYNGERRLRPRLGGYLGAYHRVWSTVTTPPSDPTWTPACPQDDGYTCFDRFQYNLTSDPTDPTGLDPTTWGNLVPAGGNPCGPTTGDQALWGDVEVLIFEQFSTSKLRVSCVDTNKQIVYLTGPTAVPGPANASEAGFVTGNRYVIENVKGALTQPGQWFLDRSTSPMTLTYLARPGENPNSDTVIVPQASQLLVGVDVRYLTFRGLTFEHDNFVVPSQGHVSTELEAEATSALSFQNSGHITIDSVMVRHTAGGGIDFTPCLQKLDENGKPASPDWCQQYDTAAQTSGNVVRNSVFYDLGLHGIRIGQNLDDNTLQSLFNDATSPHGYIVQNNVIAGYGRVIPAAFGIGQGVGHDNLYANNDVYDGYHCAISISQGGDDSHVPNGVGNANNTIAFNHVHDLLQGIMNDGGSIRIEAGNSAYTAPGNRIVNNRIHDTSDASALDSSTMTVNGVPVTPGYGGDGIYMDNSTGLVDVENNLVYRVSGNAIYSPHGPQNASPSGPQGLGQANYIKNNILAFARKGMVAVNDPYYSQTNGPPYTAHPAFLVTNNLMYFDRSGSSSPSFYVQTDCTFSADLPYAGFQLFQDNLYWRSDRGFATDPTAFHVQPKPIKKGPCSKSNTADWNFYSFFQPSPSWQIDLHEDVGSVVTDPLFVRPEYPFDDFRLRRGSPGVGFVPFDPNQAGRQYGWWTPPPVAPGFATAPFNPATDF